MSETEMVRCADCGFAAFFHSKTREHYPIDGDSRETGKTPQGWTGSGWMTMQFDVFESAPRCYVKAHRIHLEFPRNDGEHDFLAILNKPRECSKFMSWIEGYSPREHLEMMFSEQQLERERRWQQEQSERQHRQHLQSLLVAIIGIIASAVIAFYAGRNP